MDDRRPGNTSSFIPPVLGSVHGSVQRSLPASPPPSSLAPLLTLGGWKRKRVSSTQKRAKSREKSSGGGLLARPQKTRRQSGKWLKEKGIRTTAPNEWRGNASSSSEKVPWESPFLFSFWKKRRVQFLEEGGGGDKVGGITGVSIIQQQVEEGA